MKFKFWKSEPKVQKPEENPRSALDRALTKVSLLEDVVSTSECPDGTIVIYVRGGVDKHYDRIVELIQTHAPGVHGQIRRAAEAAEAAARRPAEMTAALLH